jgi:hypothetical protein
MIYYCCITVAVFWAILLNLQFAESGQCVLFAEPGQYTCNLLGQEMKIAVCWARTIFEYKSTENTVYTVLYTNFDTVKSYLYVQVLQ